MVPGPVERHYLREMVGWQTCGNASDHLAPLTCAMCLNRCFCQHSTLSTTCIPAVYALRLLRTGTLQLSGREFPARLAVFAEVLTRRLFVHPTYKTTTAAGAASRSAATRRTTGIYSTDFFQPCFWDSTSTVPA